MTLAATHTGSLPTPVIVLIAIAAIGYVLWSRMKGQPLKGRRLVVLPAILTVIGITDLTGSSAPHLNPTADVFLVLSIGTSVILGALRGATIELYPNQGELWQRYRRSTVALWIALILSKVLLLGVAHIAGAGAAGGTDSLLLSLGASLLAEAAIVGPRALSTGVPFAANGKSSDTGGASRWENMGRMSTPPADPNQQAPWRSPGWRDGLDWARQQINEPGRDRARGQVDDPGTDRQ